MLVERSIESFRTIAIRAAEPLLGYRWKIWFWGDSIGLEGLLAAAELTGDGRYFNYVYGLMKAWVARRQIRSQFEYTAAGVALLSVYEKTRDAALLEAAYEFADYLAGFRRTDHGAYVRYEDAAIELPPELPPEHSDFQRAAHQAQSVTDGGPCVFVDNMHFDGPFFAKMYAVTREERFRKLAVDNLLSSIELLFEPQAELFFHFWMERTKKTNGILWGRGNGWAMLGMLHTLSYLSETDPALAVILSVFQRQAKALVALQDRSGDWHTILAESDSYLETSIAAFVVDGFSLAIRRGWLSADYRPAIELALDALLQHVRPDGTLAGVSYETFPSTRAEHYGQIPRDAVVPWGQGPLLTALRSYQLLCEQ